MQLTGRLSIEDNPFVQTELTLAVQRLAPL